MTQLRKFRDSISNYFDEIERGIGKRGSTFTDVDAVSHDIDTHRFLFREFKQQGERLDKAQRWVLTDLADLPCCTVWFLRRIDGRQIGFGQFRSGRREEIISESEYRERLRRWWANVEIFGPARPIADVSRELTAADIRWG